jgi:pyridoxal biosynthesis lyase PdxS
MSDLMVSEATLRINGLARQMRRWKMSDDIEDIAVRLRRTRADMLGTDDEEHYFDCHEAVHVIEELRDEITNLNELAKDRYCTMQTEIERLCNIVTTQMRIEL